MDNDMIIALDLHKDFSRALIVDSQLNILRDEKISHDGKHHLAEFFASFAAETNVVMEATFNWPWVAQLALDHQLIPHLADCKTARLRSGKSKSDRLDALWLARLWFSKELFPHCYVPSAEQLSIRDQFRHRKLLVGIQTSMKNSIHGFLFRQGVNLSSRISDIFGRRGLWQMRKLRLAEPQAIMLADKLSALEAIRRQISLFDSRFKAYAHSDENCILLMTIPGIAELTAFGIMAEIGRVDRFPNRRALAAYAGVLPRLNESADKDLGRHTGFDCNRHLRLLAVESVTGAVTGSRRFRSLHRRVSARNKAAGSKARVAVARAVMETVWIVLSRKQVYMEKPLPSGKAGKQVSPWPLSA